jgi:hypothetical protein
VSETSVMSHTKVVLVCRNPEGQFLSLSQDMSATRVDWVRSPLDAEQRSSDNRERDPLYYFAPAEPSARARSWAVDLLKNCEMVPVTIVATWSCP